MVCVRAACLAGTAAAAKLAINCNCKAPGEASAVPTAACKCSVAVIPWQDANQQQQQRPNCYVPVPQTQAAASDTAKQSSRIWYSGAHMCHTSLASFLVSPCLSSCCVSNSVCASSKHVLHAASSYKAVYIQSWHTSLQPSYMHPSVDCA